MNTWFRQPSRRTWTRRSPGDRARNQIDYVTMNKRFRNAVKRTIALPGAYCNGDHIPVVVDMEVHLTRPKKINMKPKLNIKLLKSDKIIRDLYSACMRNKFETLRD